jgi:hypothetical protein
MTLYNVTADLVMPYSVCPQARQGCGVHQSCCKTCTSKFATEKAYKVPLEDSYSRIQVWGSRRRKIQI